MDITFHFPPDLLHLLGQTIPRLCRSKKNTILFFKGAGVDKHITNPLMRRVNLDKDSVSKYEIVEIILTKLNEKGEATLRERREVLRRVVEYEDFSSCYPNDALAAEGLVAKVRTLVNVKDSFTKMQQEEERHRLDRAREKRRDAEISQQKQADLENAKKQFYALFAEQDPVRRGKLLEPALNDLFRISDILVSESFTRVGGNGEGIIEQIDGVVQLDGEFYLVEMKWWAEPLGPGEVSQHMVRVHSRGQSRGMFISASGYTGAAIDMCRQNLQTSVFVMFELKEIVMLLEGRNDLKWLLREKIKAAIVHKNPFYQPALDDAF